jgi:copper chaperone NosL
LTISATPLLAIAADCTVAHPFKPPRKGFQGQCPVCGMVRPMWARTWITFDTYEGVDQVCSFHCLADWVKKTGRSPRNVMLSVYHAPERMVSAEKAVIVVGSPASGTMSPVSKVVFDDAAAAEAFSASCGGDVVDYSTALALAASSVSKENGMINAKRLKMGKIVEPSDADECPVCSMYPTRYPYGKCQIQDKQGQTLHFCSTQCLFAYLGKPSLYGASPVSPFLIWVVDRGTGMWISGRTAFYVLGSTRVFGPMGYEALPFNSMKAAGDFVVDNGGRVAGFADVSIEKIVPNWRY